MGKFPGVWLADYARPSKKKSKVKKKHGQKPRRKKIRHTVLTDDTLGMSGMALPYFSHTSGTNADGQLTGNDSFTKTFSKCAGPKYMGESRMKKFILDLLVSGAALYGASALYSWAIGYVCPREITLVSYCIVGSLTVGITNLLRK